MRLYDILIISQKLFFKNAFGVSAYAEWRQVFIDTTITSRGFYMDTLQNIEYREILISPLRECESYTPKFGHGTSKGFSLDDFRRLYGADPFYKWLGLDNSLVYSAHKAAGGITSMYRQIGIGSERLFRRILIDHLGLSNADVNWSYTVPAANKKKQRTLSLDGRIILDKVSDPNAMERVSNWMNAVSEKLELSPSIQRAMTGVVFEIRQGYKSKDSKRQNADIANASNAYANGYIPCLMVMSAQIDDDIVARYIQAKWAILLGNAGENSLHSTYAFFKNIIGFDFARFMKDNQPYLQSQTHKVLERLMRAE